MLLLLLIIEKSVVKVHALLCHVIFFLKKEEFDIFSHFCSECTQFMLFSMDSTGIYLKQNFFIRIIIRSGYSGMN